MENGTIRTASLEHALDGTVRRTIVDICRRENIPLEETSPNLSEIDAWKTPFITSTSRLVLPVNILDFPELPSAPRYKFASSETVTKLQELILQELKYQTVDVAAC